MKQILTIALMVLCTCATAMAQFNGTTVPDVPMVPPTPGFDNQQPAVDITKTLPDSLITFQDRGIKDFCVEWLKNVDTNHDGEVSKAEALRTTTLNLMPFRSFIRVIRNYDDLKWFPNLESLSAGSSYVDTLDLRHNPKLTFLRVSECRALKVVILAEGCQPEIIHEGGWLQEAPKVIYAKEE
jgi:hypothetical protein